MSVHPVVVGVPGLIPSRKHEVLSFDPSVLSQVDPAISLSNDSVDIAVTSNTSTYYFVTNLEFVPQLLTMLDVDSAQSNNGCENDCDCE